MDRLDAMRVFLAVADAGSLSAAGRRLNTPLATISRKMSELEVQLKARLLNRSSRRITLTDAGRAYVEACRRILEEVGEAERAASGEYSAPKGELVISAPVVFGRLDVLPVVTTFLRTYPDVDIHLVLADRVVNLWDEHIDVAVRIGELPDSSLVAIRVGSIRRVVCGSPAYFAGRGPLREPAELSAHACITFESLMSANVWSFRSERSETVVPVHSRLTVNTAEAAIDAAVAGLGVTRVLSYQVAKYVAAGALTVVLEAFEPLSDPAHLVYTGGRRLPLKLRAFLDFAAPRLKAALTERDPVRLL